MNRPRIRLLLGTPAILVFACASPYEPAQPVGAAGVAGGASAPTPRSDPPQSGAAENTPRACPDFNPSKNLYWGDLHVHTSYSLDAFAAGDRTDPAGAFAFAAGLAPVQIAEGVPPDGVAREERGPLVGPLSPRLDFAAITDHSEFMAEAYGCSDTAPGNEVFYASVFCKETRAQGSIAQAVALLMTGRQLNQVEPQSPLHCLTYPLACPREAGRAWREDRAAVRAAYRPCTFTSLVGYEWSAQTGERNLHRNIIFASEDVPPLPLDYIRYPTVQSLWNALEQTCTGNCRVLTVPHNSNASGGRMFSTQGFTRADFVHMAKYQRLVEVFQHKGSSECWSDRSDTGNDVQCDYELLPEWIAPEHKAGYVRSALEQGLTDYSSGVAGPKIDPLQLGVIGSTDTHNATPGNVDESTWPGHAGKVDDTPLLRVQAGPSVIFGASVNFNPGGVTAVWAEENTRAAIFDAFERREAYATSGPRIALRFYAYAGDADPCADPAFPAGVVASGGVPMGGTLGAASTAPRFVAYALKDRTDLMSVEIFKAAHSVGTGALREDSFVFTRTSQPHGALGATITGSRACVTWEDPGYDRASPALYYARVLEQPTKRWSVHDCAAAKATKPLSWPEIAPGCACNVDGQVVSVTVGAGASEKTTTIQCDSRKTGILDVARSERAWGSPIWVLP